MIEALVITITAMTIVFLILIMLLIVLKLLNYLPKNTVEKAMVAKSDKRVEIKEDLLALEDLSDDAIAAVLVAIIDYSQDVKKNVQVISVKEI